jgi:hypothetical protein
MPSRRKLGQVFQNLNQALMALMQNQLLTKRQMGLQEAGVQAERENTLAAEVQQLLQGVSEDKRDPVSAQAQLGQIAGMYGSDVPDIDFFAPGIRPSAQRRVRDIGSDVTDRLDLPSDIPAYVRAQAEIRGVDPDVTEMIPDAPGLPRTVQRRELQPIIESLTAERDIARAGEPRTRVLGPDIEGREFQQFLTGIELGELGQTPTTATPEQLGRNEALQAVARASQEAEMGLSTLQGRQTGLGALAETTTEGLTKALADQSSGIAGATTRAQQTAIHEVGLEFFKRNLDNTVQEAQAMISVDANRTMALRSAEQIQDASNAANIGIQMVSTLEPLWEAALPEIMEMTVAKISPLAAQIAQGVLPLGALPENVRRYVEAVEAEKARLARIGDVGNLNENEQTRAGYRAPTLMDAFAEGDAASEKFFRLKTLFTMSPILSQLAAPGALEEMRLPGETDRVDVIIRMTNEKMEEFRQQHLLRSPTSGTGDVSPGGVPFSVGGGP